MCNNFENTNQTANATNPKTIKLPEIFPANRVLDSDLGQRVIEAARAAVRELAIPDEIECYVASDHHPVDDQKRFVHVLLVVGRNSEHASTMFAAYQAITKEKPTNVCMSHSTLGSVGDRYANAIVLVRRDQDDEEVNEDLRSLIRKYIRIYRKEINRNVSVNLTLTKV